MVGVWGRWVGALNEAFIIIIYRVQVFRQVSYYQINQSAKIHFTVTPYIISVTVLLNKLVTPLRNQTSSRQNVMERHCQYSTTLYVWLMCLTVFFIFLKLCGVFCWNPRWINADAVIELFNEILLSHPLTHHRFFILYLLKKENVRTVIHRKQMYSIELHILFDMNVEKKKMVGDIWHLCHCCYKRVQQ